MHPATLSSRGVVSAEVHLDAANPRQLSKGQCGHGQQAAADSSRQHAPASPGLHGGRSRRFAQARSTSFTWRPRRQQRRRSDPAPPCPKKSSAYYLKGVVDHKAKVCAAFIPGAKKRSSRRRGRPAVASSTMAATTTLLRSSSGNVLTLSELMHIGHRRKSGTTADGLPGVPARRLRYERQADTSGRPGV